MTKLADTFYLGSDVIRISKQLLGRHLFTRLPFAPQGRNGREKPLTGGIIVETEAYAGPIDRASHAYANRRTSRTEVMYGPGGIAYVYLCYGIHSLFNIITNVEGVPHAVLIRALEPTHGIASMLKRRRMRSPERRLTAGPGVLSQALGITTEHDGADLTGNRIWIETRGRQTRATDIIASSRVGVSYAGPDADKPWRFRVRNNPWTSPAE